MKIFMYPGTFDPFTLGHADIAKRSAALCDKLIVAISQDRAGCMFDTKKRTDLARKTLADIKNCEIVTFQGLLADFAVKNKVDCIVRGVRSVNDFEFESSLMLNYKYMAPGIENIMLLTDRKCVHISSSVVRDIIKYKGRLNGYVSDEIINDFGI